MRLAVDQCFRVSGPIYAAQLSPPEQVWSGDAFGAPAEVAVSWAKDAKIADSTFLLFKCFVDIASKTRLRRYIHT